MQGYLLLADGTRLDGELRGATDTAVGWLVANTAVVGFQEMATDPAYRGALLAFTYPEVGNIGVARVFAESPQVQPAALVVKVLSEYRSHYLSEGDLEDVLRAAGVPCLCDVDTRWIAVHLREHGEMAAAVAPAAADADALLASLASLERPQFEPPGARTVPEAGGGPTVAVLDLGLRSSDLAQLALCCRPVLLAHDADASAVAATGARGVVVSDGPGGGLPPGETVRTLQSLVGQVPVLAWGLGHVALGMALGCEPAFLKRGHHGANYAVRNISDGKAEVTCQRHSVALDRGSVEGSDRAELLWENINDGTAEGIRSADGSATGLQFMPVAAQAGAVSAHVRRFVEGIS